MTPTRVGEIRLNQRNTNRGTDRGMESLRQSIDRVGWTTAGVISADGVVLAGNHRKKVADERGEEPVIIPVDGKRPVFLQLPVQSGTPEAFLISVLDNRVSQLNLNLDAHAVVEQAHEYGVPVEYAGYTIEEVTIAEDQGTTIHDPMLSVGDGGGTGHTGDGEHEKTIAENFSVLISCRDEKEQRQLYERLTAEKYSCRLLTM